MSHLVWYENQAIFNSFRKSSCGDFESWLSHRQLTLKLMLQDNEHYESRDNVNKRRNKISILLEQTVMNSRWKLRSSEREVYHRQILAFPFTDHRGFKPNIFQLGPFFYPSTSNSHYFCLVWARPKTKTVLKR